jgi:co-chaperonin GroES (HSP10)
MSNLKLRPLGDRLLIETIEGEETFAGYAGTETKLDGTKYLIMRESDVYAVVEG